MAWRFRKRVKIAPGLFLNAGSRGLGLSIGPRGASVSFGPSGVYTNASIPGLGLYSRQRIGGGMRGPSKEVLRLEAKREKLRQLQADLEFLARFPPRACLDGQEGPIVLRTAEDGVLDPRIAEVAWKDFGDQIVAAVTALVNKRQAQVDELSRLHLLAPCPEKLPAFTKAPFAEVPPAEIASESYHWFLQLFSSHRQGVDKRNADARREYEQALAAWESRKVQHEQREADRYRMYVLREDASHTAKEAFLTWHFEQLEWPRETEVSFELSPDCGTLFLDVDLPEIEDLPDGVQEMTARAPQCAGRSSPRQRGVPCTWTMFTESA